MTEITAGERSFDKVRRKMVMARIEFLGHLAKFRREALRKRPGENEWSPLEITYHLYLTEGLILEQMRRVQEEDGELSLESVASAEPHIAPDETALSLENVLASLAARREETFEYLSALPDDAWIRPLRHEDWGEMKFYQLANLLAQHDQTHSQQLIAVREKLAALP
jgi:hypothetical protein